MPKIIGIDLGTTNSAVAVMEAGEPNILESKEGKRTTPSVVAINTKTDERFVGELARRQSVTNAENTIYSAKRFIGRRHDDKSVKEDSERISYKLDKAKNGDVQIILGGKKHTPTEISAMVLQKLKEDAEHKLGDKVTQAVITVPAYLVTAKEKLQRLLVKLQA